MRLAALFSGGKDSAYSILRAVHQGHKVACLITASPRSEESMLFHHPNVWITKLQSESMGLEQIFVQSEADNPAAEKTVLEEALREAARAYDVRGAVHGGIRSDFQRRNFEDACRTAGLKVVSPLWHERPERYIRNLLRDGFEFMITGVSADGLDQRWLGATIDFKKLDELERLARRFGFSPDFEGGEAESMVVDCPLFSRRIRIDASRITWDGVRGRFEITEATLEDRA